MSPRLLPAGLTLALVLSALVPTDSRATTIHVIAGGGGDFATIKEGVAAAGAGDTVLVAAGRYSGPNNRGIDFGAVNRVLLSESGAANTNIDGESQDAVIYLQSGLDSTTVVRGFTISNGLGGNGGGMMVYQAAPRIADCIFRDNRATSNGGGLWVGYTPTPVTVSGCVFVGNTATYRAGGMMADHSTVTITGCVFRSNSTSTVIEDPGYGGGAIQTNLATVLVTGCTLAGNSAQYGPGGIQSASSTMTVERTIVALSLKGAGIRGASVSGCVVFANPGGDVFDGTESNTLHVDPLFCDLAGGVLTVCANSPCLPTAPANPIGQLIGVYRDGCGSCASPVVGTTWGEVKALYR